MKVAPILAEMRRHPGMFTQRLVHTGQHYDHAMSAAFLEQLGFPTPDEFLNAGSGTHAAQTAKVMLAFEPVLMNWRPDWVVVVGDVNSTLACALVAAKLSIPVAHVEAGLRSCDRSMPEEINRILTDHLADLLLTPSEDAGANLLREGAEPHKIRFVGNVMIDSLTQMLPAARRHTIVNDLGLKRLGFALLTLHRPSNVDDPVTLKRILDCLGALPSSMPLVFPVHPRTRQRLAELGDGQLPANLVVLNPQDYVSFLSLMRSARFVLTDSGGIQEETTCLGVRCLTLRSNTERPVTITCGTNRLVPSLDGLPAAVLDAITHPVQGSRIPALWDGRTAERIVQTFLELHGRERSWIPDAPRAGYFAAAD